MSHLTNTFGTLTVVTSPLEGRPGFFISAVMRNGLPFDAAIVEGAEAAAAAHAKFCICAVMFQPIADGMDVQDVVVNMPNPGSLN
jgi:hypothetical protein